LHKPQPRLRIEFSLVEFPAALEAGDRSFDPAGSREIFSAPGTPIEERPGTLPDWKRQGMAARFVPDAEIAAGTAPMRSMRRNAARTGAKLGE
jgi:hypothetical protein